MVDNNIQGALEDCCRLVKRWPKVAVEAAMKSKLEQNWKGVLGNATIALERNDKSKEGHRLLGEAFVMIGQAQRYYWISQGHLCRALGLCVAVQDREYELKLEVQRIKGRKVL